MGQTSGTRRIDAHQHFWRYTMDEFGWINDSMASIRSDFLPADILPLLNDAGMDATVAVQARQSLEETDWLLALAEENTRIAGVVGWVPLIDPNVEEILDRLSTRPLLKGIRHVLQGEADEYMAREDFNAGIALLRRYGLIYDVLVVERQLPAAIGFVDRHPEQMFVLDHAGKPLIAAHELEPWRTNILELARRENVTCKISGMVTEADFGEWTEEELRPYVDTVVEAFGPSRLLFGSDWPVCTVASEYKRWVNVVHRFVSKLSNDEQAAIFGGSAEKFYMLDKR